MRSWALLMKFAATTYKFGVWGELLQLLDKSSQLLGNKTVQVESAKDPGARKVSELNHEY